MIRIAPDHGILTKIDWNFLFVSCSLGQSVVWTHVAGWGSVTEPLPVPGPGQGGRAARVVKEGTRETDHGGDGGSTLLELLHTELSLLARGDHH